MTIRISKPEMELLGYLHENATRFDGKERFHPGSVALALGTTEDHIVVAVVANSVTGH